MSTLERAIAIAAEAHAGQVDKAGEPYILHPLRVMMRLETDDDRIVGVLHDVVEDNATWPLAALRAEGFAEAILVAIDAVTRREDEDYESFVRRAGQNEIGRRVKLADLADNMELTRIKTPGPKDHERMERYRKAREILLA
ncbi:HD domain-containing protein [Aestuariivirga sp. YIM B02566]|uniref:HD domain-containing protein n=1 Tax=Taklimakanibacter albus TaxID=2800327 RepID=A0ACC5R103_9HYPH|nr:HD domain-containing protein [Aestuariivirga sp. YIM B02566]MBK1866280.1 HD domain-containing protein [Aestuariivirga sp. YIM B02566]